MNLILCRATTEDAQELCSLFRDYQRELKSFGMEYTFPEEQMESFLKGKIRPRMGACILAKDSERLIGFLFCSINRLSGYSYEASSLYGYINEIYIVSAYRGQGVARALCEEAYSWLEDNGITYAELMVLENNNLGQRFWQNQGFVPVSKVYGKKLIKTEE